MQAVGIEAVGGVEQHRDLLGDARLDRLGPAARRGVRPRGERGDLLHALAQDLPQRLAFAAAHRGEFGQRPLEAGDRPPLRRPGAPPRCSSSSMTSITPLSERMPSSRGSAASTSPASDVDGRSSTAASTGSLTRTTGATPCAPDGERSVDRAAREHLRCAVARRHLDRVPARRQAQPQIQSLGVDRFELPGPAIGAVDAVATRKAGHARERHRDLYPNRGTNLAMTECADVDLTGGARAAHKSRGVPRRSPAALYCAAPPAAAAG